MVLGIVIFALAALLAQIAVVGGLPALDTSSAEDELRAAWQRAQQAGAYGFTADAEQTLIPRPLPSMIGETNQRADWRLEGEVTLPDYARLKLRFEGGGFGASPVEVIQDGTETYMLVGGEQVPVENPAGLSSPTADYLGYLAAAENVRVSDQSSAEGSDHASRITHYVYDISGARFAEHVRDQTQSQFEKGATIGGQPLPHNVTLSPSPLLQRTTGRGELWVDARGLPLRQVVYLNMPEVNEEYDAQVHLVVDYNFGKAGDLAAASGQAGGILGTIGRLPPFRDLAELHMSQTDVLFLLLAMTLSFGLIGWRRRQRLYGLIAVTVSVSMVVMPLLQANGVARFFARQAEAADSTQSIVEALGISDGPNEFGTLSVSSEPSSASSDTQPAVRSRDNASRFTFYASGSPSSSESTPDLYCGKGSTTEDADNDGLSDADENCLGTDPYHEDSDRDTITDTLEIDGFDYGGRHWTSNPFTHDSNQDGLTDFAEWPYPVGAAPDLDVADDWDPDGDGVPNLWDEDNDGDEVPDGIDLSPYARTTYSDNFSLSIQGGDFDGYLYVEMQLQPEDMSHLRYSTGYLDWPDDELGQLQDLDGSTEDIRLIPVFRIHTNRAPDRDLVRNGGVTVFEEDDGYVLYVTPMPVSDGGRIVAFSAMMAYRPDQLADIRWEKVELVWMVQMSVDQQVGEEVETSVIPLHSYLEESFRVTGLQITKSGSFEAAILGTTESPEEDRWIFNLLFGLGSTFLTHQKPALRAETGQDSLETRFTNPNTPLEQTWGVTSTLVTMDLPVTPYGHSDEGVADLQTRIRSFLDVNGYPTDGYPSLVIATESESGLYGLDDQGQFQPQAEFNLNLNNVSMTTMRGLKSNTYKHEDGTWVSLDLQETLEVMQGRYEDELSDIVADLRADYPDLTEEDLALLLNMFYTAWFVGQTRIISMDGQPLASDSRSDEDVFDTLNHDQNTLPAYLIEATQLGQPGGGLRIGDNPAQSYTYERELDTGGNTNGFISPAWIQAGTAVLQTVKTCFAMRTTFQAVRFAKATGSWTGKMGISASKNAGAGARKLGLAGAILAVALIWTMFFVSAAGTGWDWDSPAVKFAAAYASVATVMTALLFAISLNPIGAIVVFVLGLLDLICFALTWLITGEGFSFMDWLTKKIAGLFYNVDVLTKLGRMDFVDFDTALLDEELGLIVGNRFRISAEFVGKIKGESEAEEEDVEDSWVDASYHGVNTGVPWVNKNGRKECSTRWWWWDKTCRNEVAVEWQLDTVQRNLKLTAKSSVEAKTYYQECTLGICKRKTQWTHLPADLEYKGNWQPMDFYLDVLPDNVHDLWNWGDINNPDLDGDGLSDDEEGSLGTLYNDWDTDDDGLSDKLEYDLGTNPTRADSDGDGLSDGLEYRIGTEIKSEDSDDDGLTDGDEVFHPTVGDWAGGWAVTLPTRTAWVFSDPLDADSDGDGLNDRSERSAAASPYAYNDSPHLTLEADPLSGSPSGAVGAYVTLDNTVTMHLTLDNTDPRPITSVLTLCLPDFLTNRQYEATMSGDRNPPTQAAASCDGLEWSFAGQHALLEHQIVNTTVTATVANLTVSTSDEVTVNLPFQVGEVEQDITDQIRVIVDLEDPEVAIVAPTDGVLLGGGISHYVIGGSSSDETSWVTTVEVELPIQGRVEAEGTSPWAYTWELPADGQYILQAHARDYLDHEASSSTVNVTVDNTPPQVTLDLVDGQVVTTQSSDVISITLTGDASDNLTGLTRVQVSTDGRPWREVGQVANLTYAEWSTDWVLSSQASAQGEHIVDVRAIDQAGNVSETLRRTIIVDVVPPASELTDRTYLQDTPPHFQANQQLDFYGVANDAGRVPQPSRPAELVGDLDGLDDATIWLELSSVTDDDDGVSVAWLGDTNSDRLADLAIGLPAAEAGAGQVTVVYGRAGGWPTPTDAEVLADSLTSFVGKAGAGIGDEVAAAGDVNGDGFADLLIGDAANDRVFLVFGQPNPLGRDVTLDEPNYPYWSAIDLTGLQDLSGLTAAGDVNGDGLDDLLIGTAGAGGKAYLLLGEAGAWWETVPLADKAAAVIAAAGARLSGVGDMDGDQYDEFVVVDDTTVYLFEGQGFFATYAGESLELSDAIATFGSVETRPEVAALGDVNGDSLTDFIYADGDQPKLVFGETNRNWTTQALSFTPAASGFLAAPGDVDDDGLADILVGNAEDNAYLILGKDTSEVKATLTDVRAAASTLHAAGADLNSDGSSDLLLVPGTLGMGAMGVLSYGQTSHVDPSALPLAASKKTPGVSQRVMALQGVTHTVDDDGGADFVSIQDAVTAANDGDTINVEPGAYTGFTVGGVNDLTISGEHPDAVFVDGGGGVAVTIQNATGVTLNNLTIRNASDAVYLANAGVGGYDNQSLVTNIQYLLIYDFTSNALAMDRVSTARLTRCTLAGAGNHIELYGAPDSAMDASWSTVSTDSRTATSADGGIFADSDEIYFVDDSGQMDIYNPGTDVWRSLAEAPSGLHADVTADESGHLWALRQDPSSGFDGPVYDIAYVSANEVYVGGDFQHAGDVETPYIAQWNGSGWQAVFRYDGWVPDGAVYALEVDSDQIYAGGAFGLRYLPLTDPFPDWQNWGDISGGGAVYAIAVSGSDVWVGGSFNDIGGIPAHKLAKRQSGTWKLAGAKRANCNGIRGSHVSALVKKDDRLIVGGHFDGVESSYYSPKCYVSDEANLARVWWGSAGNASKLQDYNINETGHVYALEVVGDNIVVGGDFYSLWCQEDDEGRGWCGGGGRARNLAILEPDGDWSVPSYLKTNSPPVRALEVAGNHLYIGGDFTQVGGTAIDRVAYYDNFPGGGGAWHSLGDGVNDSVRAIVHSGGHTYIAGTFTLAGDDAAFRFAHWDGGQWVGLSEQAFYEYDGAWHARSILPDFVGAGASIVSDENGLLYAVPGSGSSELYQYTISSDTWAKKAPMPGGLGAGGGLALRPGSGQAWTGDHLFALAGGDSRDLYRYDPAEDTWDTRAAIPAWGPVVGVGGEVIWDGRDWLYVLAGGNGTDFLRYHIHADQWEDLQNTSSVVNLGGGLVRIGQNVYGVPGGGQVLWSYDPVAIYPEKLTLDHVAVIAPETASASTWINLADLVVWPDDFVVGGADNTWIGRSGIAWSPEPVLDGSAEITHDDARVLDLNRDVYRVGTGTKLDGGYHTYRPDAIVAGDGSEEFTSLQDAIASSANRVLIRPGTYQENLYLISGVEVVGDSADLVILEPEAGSTDPLVRAEGVVGTKLMMLTLNGAGSGVDGLSVEDGTQYVVAKQNIIRGTDTAISTTGGDTALEVVNNTIVYNVNGAVASDCAPVDVRNTIFAHHSGTGLTYDGCATQKLHKYNLYWSNTADLSPNDPGAGELFLDPLFVNPGDPSHDYHTLDGSPVIDAGDPGDPPPPGAGARVDIGYIDQNRAGLYVDDDYCPTCVNDGLSWGVDAFANIQDALDKADDNIHDLKGLRYTVGIAAGTYTEVITVPSYVRLMGAGPEETVIDAHAINEAVVTFDGVVESEITGFAIRAYTNTTAINVTGAANNILITRNVIETWNRTSTESAVAFSGRATGVVTFNTFISHTGDRGYSWPVEQRDNGVSISGVGTWVAVENNIFSGALNYRQSGCDNFYEGHFYGLHTLDFGQIFNGYNLHRNKVDYRDDANTGLSEGPGDLRYSNPCFEYGTYYHLEPASQARDAASPYAEVLPGGGERADLGYHELTATPATVFLGREDVSSATGNSGVTQVEVGFSQVSDPDSAVADTLPSSWTVVTLDSPDETLTYWQTSYVPTQQSLYRFYSRAADVATNEEGDEQDWYDGAFVTDSTLPVVAWTSPANGSFVSSPLELRAEVYDYAAGAFSVADFYFKVDGNEVQAEWAADPWDEESQQPRTFRAWVNLGAGSHSAFAVATDRAGNEGQSSSVNFTVSGSAGTDGTAPILTILSPTEGGWFTSVVEFSGTVADNFGGTGVAAVEVSLDGGFTWQPATVDGANWELTWEAPEGEEYISYPAWVRARDQAGNSTMQARTFSIDNVPPNGPDVTEFKAIAIFPPLEKDAPPGTHLDMPMNLRITWRPPVDGSGVATTLIAVDQMTDTLPTDNLGVLTTTIRSLSGAGDWYVHLAVEDLVGNQFVRHYGPWHVGTFLDLTTELQDKVQTIVVDGQIDLDLAVEEWHDFGWEWGIFELMDDFSPASVLDWLGPQRQFVTWDGNNLFMGWSGAWWELDGDLWIYLNAQTLGTTQLVTDVTGCLALPFEADYAIHITSPTEGTLWEWDGVAWTDTGGTDWEFAQGDSGDTEIRMELDMSSVSAYELGLISFAVDDEGEPWAIFPTTNSLEELCSESYLWVWDWLTGDITDPSEGQPVSLDALVSVSSPQAPNGAWCPGGELEYVITLNNLENEVIAELLMALDLSASPGMSFESEEGAADESPDPDPAGDTWMLLVPSIETDASHTITITGRLDTDLSGISTVGVFGDLRLFDAFLEEMGISLGQVGLSHKVDSQAPTVQIATTPGQMIGTGPQTVFGTADDGTGSGVDSVEVSVDGGSTWSQATGTMNWAATITVPTEAITVEVRARAADACGVTGGEDVAIFDVDTNAPTVTVVPPQYVTGISDNLGGTTSDVEGDVAQVEVQFDDETAAWKSGQVYSPDASGTQNWNYTWHLPVEDCVAHTVRARAADTAGNLTVSGWVTVTVDNVPPSVDVTQVLTEVWQQDPSDPVVLEGSAGDGCDVDNLEVIVYAPDATSYRDAVSWNGSNWEYAPDFDSRDAGEYVLRVEATDLAGNITLEGPFDLLVKEGAPPSNDPPVAVDDGATVAEGGTVTELDSAETSVLANDSDPENDNLTVTTTPVSSPSHGSLTLNDDGTFSYTHDGSETTSDSFTYEVCDDGSPSECATAMVNITVTPVNDPPVANDDSAETDEDTPVTINVLGNDTDVDEDTLSVDSVTQPSNGTVTNNTTDVSYAPAADYCGDDSFTYTASDGNDGTDTATVSVSVECVNDAPVAEDDSAETDEDSPVTVAVLANDSDSDDDPLTVTEVSDPPNGTATINLDDTITYEPDPDFCGQDTFTYTISDSNDGTDSATVTVEVACVNDPPDAVDDAYSGVEDTTLNVAMPGVLGNDTDPEAHSLSVSSYDGTSANGGSVSMNTDGSFSYAPAADYCGDDTFTYTANDGNDGTDTATVSVSVECVNDAPVAEDDSAETDEDSPVTVAVLANDSDSDDDPLTVTEVSDPPNGTATINLDDTITYEPDPDFCGQDTFTYTISDSKGGTDTATVNVTITCVNDAPVANDDSADVNEDSVAFIDVLGNDTDVEDDALSVDSVTLPGHGMATTNNGAGVLYSPNLEYCGPDSFTYAANDGNGGTDSATVSVTVTCVNDAPVANDDTATTDEDTPVTMDVLANDGDVDGDSLSVTNVTQPSNGAVTVNPDNTITYTPNPGFNGDDSFTYTANDGTVDSNVAVVTITVTPAAGEFELGDFVAFSVEFTRLRSKSKVISGNVGANLSLPDNGDDDDDDDDRSLARDKNRDRLVEVRVGEHVEMPDGSKVVGDTIWLRKGSTVYDVHYNELVNSKGTILGDEHTPLDLPVLTLPALPDITPGDEDVVVKQGKSLTLEPGHYHKITVGNKATLILTGGIYHVSTLDIGVRAKVLFQGPSEVRVQDEMETGSRTYLGPDPSTSDLQASDIIIYVEGSGRDDDEDDVARDAALYIEGIDYSITDDDEGSSHTVVKIGTKNTLLANIYAPNGRVWLKSKTEATGAFIGEQVRIGEKVELSLDSAF